MESHFFFLPVEWLHNLVQLSIRNHKKCQHCSTSFCPCTQPTLSWSLSHYWARNVKCHLSISGFMSLNVPCTSHFVFSVLVHYSFLDVFSRLFLVMVTLRFCPSDASIFLKGEQAFWILNQPCNLLLNLFYGIKWQFIMEKLLSSKNSISFLTTFVFYSQLSYIVCMLCDFSGVTICTCTPSSPWYSSLPLSSCAGGQLVASDEFI